MDYKKFTRKVTKNCQLVPKQVFIWYQILDKLFKKNSHNCIGKAGDVFLANYMTAHFIAPNTSPYIRYAVYFRITGPKFENK